MKVLSQAKSPLANQVINIDSAKMLKELAKNPIKNIENFQGKKDKKNLAYERLTADFNEAPKSRRNHRPDSALLEFLPG